MNCTNFILKGCLLLCCFSNLQELSAQVGIGTNAPEASAVLDLSSTHQGFLPPRMAYTEMTAIANPSIGLMVYCTDCEPQGIYYYDGSYFLNSNRGAISGNLALFDGSSLTHNGGNLDATTPYTAADDITTSIAVSGWTGDAPHNPLSFASSGRFGYTATLTDLDHNPSMPVLESNLIPDAQLTASSVANADWVPENGRLNATTSWAVSVANTSQWYQVDLGKTETVVAVATQGRHDGQLHWIQTYRIEYSIDGSTYTDYNGGVVLTGNTDSSTVVKNDLIPAISARYIRFRPETWNGFIVSRFEVYLGLPAGGSLATFQITGKAATATATTDAVFNVSLGGQSLEFSREITYSVPVVFVAAGVEDGTIPDSQLSASGSYTNFFPADGRLNQAGQNWAAAALNTSQWFQVDLGQIETVTAVATQGREDAAQWITSYRIQYSTNGSSFTDYAGGLTFVGNSDQNTIVRNAFSSTFSARYVRFLPQSWLNHISGRFEVYIQ